MKGITLFIPVFNEEVLLKKNTQKLRNYCKGLGIPFQIILASNGSSDNTEVIGNLLAEQYSEVFFFHLHEKGPGLALKEALPYVKYPYLLTLDMDLSISLKFIPKAIMALEQGKKLIIGSKQTGEQQRSVIRILLSNGFIFLAQHLLGLPYHDYSLAAKVWPTNFLKRHKQFIDRGTGYVFILIFLAHREQVAIQEIPVKCHDTRKSKFNLFHEILYRFYVLLKTVHLRLRMRKKKHHQR